MAKRQQKPREDAPEDEILQQLRARSNGGVRLGGRPINGELLAMVVWAILVKGGAVQFGTTRDASKVSFKVWYKGFPTQEFFELTEELERSLAFTLDLFLPKTPEFDDWRKFAEQFK